jgi:hypothetical protein
MPATFKVSVVLKVGSVETSIMLFLIPKWHRQVAYPSIVSILPKKIFNLVSSLLCPVLLLVVTKWSVCRQAMEG